MKSKFSSSSDIFTAEEDLRSTCQSLVKWLRHVVSGNAGAGGLHPCVRYEHLRERAADAPAPSVFCKFASHPPCMPQIMHTNVASGDANSVPIAINAELCSS
jgi:hypothetical protein